MAHIPRGPKLKVRSERESQEGTAYVIVAGAPLHYIGGYGVVGPGDLVTLPEGTKPGKYLEAINPKDVETLSADPDKADELAEAAKQRKDAEEAEAAAKAAEAAANSGK